MLLTLLCGCAGQQTAQASSTPNTATVFAMDTVLEFTVYGSPQLLEDMEEQVTSLEKAFSVTQPGSDIYALNHGQKTQVSQDTAELLSAALTLCQRTEGALDLSIYPVVRAWGFTTGEYRVPETAELAELLEKVDYRQVLCDGQAVTLAPGMEIDLGSTAKGYTGDRLLERLRDKGVTSALLNLGGNVQALGAKPDGSPWHIAIQDPFGEGNLAILDIQDQAVITSGGYERFFEEDGETYWHILDPSTGRPARKGFVSVTIVGKSGLLCDGLSTALFVMGPQKAETFWRASDDFEAVFVQEDNSVVVTEGLAEHFTLAEGHDGTAVTVLHRD